MGGSLSSFSKATPFLEVCYKRMVPVERIMNFSMAVISMGPLMV